MSRSVQHSLAVWLQRESGLGMRSALTETARFVRLSAFRNRPVPLPGGCRTATAGVLVVPGFPTSDMTTARLRLQMRSAIAPRAGAAAPISARAPRRSTI